MQFVRISWNNAPLPLSTIRGGECAGRKDELCPLDKFLDSQKNLDKLANYQCVPRPLSFAEWELIRSSRRFACFGSEALRSQVKGRTLMSTRSQTTQRSRKTLATTGRSTLPKSDLIFAESISKGKKGGQHWVFREVKAA